MTTSTSRNTPTLAPYRASSPPTGSTDADALQTYIVTELRHIQQATAQMVLMTPQVALQTPHTVAEGMIRYAKSPWRPVTGQTADGWVQFIGGAWTKFTPSTP